MTREEYHAQKAQKLRKQEMARKHYLAGKGSMDIPFLLLALLLTGIGLMMLFSASFPSAYYETGSAGYYFKRQAVFAAAGIVAMLVVGRINYQRWRGAAKIAMGFGIFLLLLVIIPGVGITKNNATRWLGIDGVFTFQPSEIVKLAVILYFADSISKKKERMLKWREGVLPYAVLLGVIAILMMLEPHLSGTILIVGTGAIMMAVGGLPAWMIGAGVGGVAVAAWTFVAAVDAGIISYGAGRINMWHDPWLDSSDEGYQMVQSLIAIGSGGLLGTGLGKGRQKFLYLPEESNDFIFSVVCEELGLLGAGLILLVFAMLLIRGFWIALHARDRFGTLLVVGVMSHLGLQVFLNVAVVTGLVPATGISLPFFSYGGTALLLQLVEVGLVLSVSRQIPAKREG